MIEYIRIATIRIHHVSNSDFSMLLVFPSLLRVLAKESATFFATFAFFFHVTSRGYTAKHPSLYITTYRPRNRPDSFFFLPRLFPSSFLPSWQVEDGGGTRRQIARAEKEEKEEEEKEEEKKEERERKRGRNSPWAHGASSVPALYTRDGWILRARDVLLSFPFLHVPTFFSYRALVFSLLCSRGRILMARKRQECETPKGCREKIARPFRGCNLSWVGGQR